MNSHWSIKFFKSEFHLFEFYRNFFEFLKCFQHSIISNFRRKSFDLFLFDNFYCSFLNQMSTSWILKKSFETKKKIENEYFEKTIFIYVDKNFEKFKNNQIIDFRSWKTIHHDFDIFDESRVTAGSNFEQMFDSRTVLESNRTVNHVRRFEHDWCVRSIE